MDPFTPRLQIQSISLPNTNNRDTDNPGCLNVIVKCCHQALAYINQWLTERNCPLQPTFYSALQYLSSSNNTEEKQLSFELTNFTNQNSTLEALMRQLGMNENEIKLIQSQLNKIPESNRREIFIAIDDIQNLKNVDSAKEVLIKFGFTSDEINHLSQTSPVPCENTVNTADIVKVNYLSHASNYVRDCKYSLALLTYLRLAEDGNEEAANSLISMLNEEQLDKLITECELQTNDRSYDGIRARVTNIKNGGHDIIPQGQHRLHLLSHLRLAEAGNTAAKTKLALMMSKEKQFEDLIIYCESQTNDRSYEGIRTRVDKFR